MISGKRCFLAAIFLCCTLSGVHGAEKATLKGYGSVEPVFGKNRVEFRCESPEKAAIFYAKLKRDISGMNAFPVVKKSVKWNSKEIPVYELPSKRFAMIGIDGGKNVTLLEAENTDALVRRLKNTRLEFPAPLPYPGYLDYYDLRAVKFYKTPMRSLSNQKLEKHWPFAKKFGIEGFMTHGLALNDNEAPGVIPFTPYDYELEAARKADGILTLCPTFGGALPMWIYNRNPEKAAKPQRSTIVTNWIPGVDGMPFDNDGPGFPAEVSPILAFQKQVMERYVNHPALGGWQLYCGKPIGDQLGMGMSGVLWDSSEEGMQAQIEWLKQHYTLAGLGERWTGNKNAYRSWNDVKPVQLMDLIGGDWDSGRLLLSDKTWHWKKAPKDSREQPPPQDGKPWVPVKMAPSHRCNFIDSGSGYYKLTLEKSKWIDEKKNRKLYLKAAVFCYDHNRLAAWINGKKFLSDRAYSAGTKQLGIELPAGTLKGDGTDTIVFQTPDGRSDGRIHGPVSLSEIPAQNYPYKDSRINARYFDSLRFQTDKVIERNRKMFSFARAIDRNRPMSLSGADTPIMTALAPFFGAQGIAMQSTATDGFFYPALPDRGRQYGFYFIGEPSGPVTTPDRFDRNLSLLFFHGCSATAIFMDIEQYMKFEKETGHLSRRAALMKHLGKSLLEQPKIGLLGTTQSFLLGSHAPWNWNLGRGELQSIHFNASMMTEQELENGIADRYPVIFDAGSAVMNEKTVDLLREYVRKGGTFVALPEAGRHSELVQNAQPVSALTGFRTVSYNRNGKIRFADSPSIFKRWAGKEMNGNGNALDWKNVQTAKGSALEKIAPDAEIIAVWTNNDEPAVGVRKIGKGRVITLGASFWRDARDINGKWLPSRYNRIFEDMLFAVGADRSSNAASERIWVRKAVTKTGLEDWLIAVNAAENEPFRVTSDLSIRLPYAPEKIIDAVTGKEVRFSYANGSALIRNVPFEKYETKIFAVPRPVTASKALETWWGEKTKYWKKGPEVKLPYLRKKGNDVISFDSWKFLADQNNTVSASDGWKKTDFNDSGWKTLGNGTWKLLIPGLAEYQGTGLYRREFTVPEEWKGKKIIFRFKHETVRDQAEFYLNGKHFKTYDAAAQHRELLATQSSEVTDLLDFNGRNILSIKVTGGKNITAGLCSVLWMEPEQKLDKELSLNGKWECVKEDFLTSVPAEIPGKAHGRFLRRTFRIPAGWKDKTIWLRLEVPQINIAAVMLNDRNRNVYANCPFGNRTVINITDLAKPGEENTIELWHRHTIPLFWRGLAWRWPSEAVMNISDVTIGCSE